MYLQRTGDLVLISKPCARSGRMVPFYFPVKNARNERPLSRPFQHNERMDIADDVTFPPTGTTHLVSRYCCLRISREQGNVNNTGSQKRPFSGRFFYCLGTVCLQHESRDLPLLHETPYVS